MPDRAVTNTSPLIFLSKAGRLELLQQIAPKILVPAAVDGEIRQRATGDVTVKALNDTAWLSVAEVTPIPSAIQAWDLGLGETSVLAYAFANRPTIAIIDDLNARRCAAAFGIPVSGTLGLILLAKKRGSIPFARPVLEEMRGLGMYLSDRVLDQALEFVGE